MRYSVRRFCIADGATEAFDSRWWARLLTKHWVFANRLMVTKAQLAPWLEALGQRFRSRWDKQNLPWYAEEKAKSGAFAAFLGLAFVTSTDGLCWQAIALGDSCLVHLRNQKVESSFPISDPDQFGYRPLLLPSNTNTQGAAIDHVVVQDGLVKNGDVFLLLTDAIAAWYLRSLSSAPDLTDAFQCYLAVNDVQNLQRLVTDCRDSGSLRNDDVAAIRIVIGHSATICAEP